MCGITGFWDLQQSTTDIAAVVQKMAEQIKERGPDSQGIWVNTEVGLALGHRRLSIVDLSPHGSQPMVSNSGRMVIIYNGELFNTQEIRQELIESGLPSQGFFHGASDTEIILEACELWGIEKAINKFIGMFAFGLWDKQEHRLHLARDRLGKKPLYWGFQEKTLFFGSQLKSFTPHPKWKPVINREVLRLYLKYGYVPEPYSIFQGMQKVKPGNIITINQNNKFEETTYWDLANVVKNSRTHNNFKEQEWIIKVEELLKDSVSRRMLADVPLGAFLSGGIDSSLVVALMQANSSIPIKTFTIGFKENGYDEAVYAKKVAEHLKTDHHELYLTTKDAIDIIPSIPAWCDEPFADSSQIPTFLVSKMARSNVTVCLSGDGGDELFAGYNRYLLTEKVWKILDHIPLPLKKLMGVAINNISPESLNKLSYISKKIPPLLGDKLHKFSKNCLLTNTSDDFFMNLISCWSNPNQILPDIGDTNIWPPFPCSLSRLERMQYYDQLTYLPGDILTKVDRASMWASLEARTPFLDHRLLELSWKLPDKLKIRQGKGKWILRQILQKYLPLSLFERPKMGFGVPIDQWLRGDLKDWAQALLTKDCLQDSSLNHSIIQKCWTEHQQKSRNWQQQLWSILMFQQWRKFY